MIVALTRRQWTAILEASGARPLIDALGTYLHVDFATNAARFKHRELLASILRPWFNARTLAEVGEALDGTGALWSAYRSVCDVVADVSDGRVAESQVQDDPSVGPNVATSGPIRINGSAPGPGTAPILGQHTHEVLEALGRLQGSGT
jgi:2-methylfumaryl-CoA isomerase